MWPWKVECCDAAGITAARPAADMANDSDDEVVIVGETSGPSNRVPTPNKRQKRESHDTAAAAGASGSGAATHGYAAITAEGDFALENLQCPICIDLLHEPCVGKVQEGAIKLTWRAAWVLRL